MPSWPRRDADDVDFPPAVDLSDSRIPMRLLTFVILTISEIFLASAVFEFPEGLPYWSSPIAYANLIALIALLASTNMARPKRSSLDTALVCLERRACAMFTFKKAKGYVSCTLDREGAGSRLKQSR